MTAEPEMTPEIPVERRRRSFAQRHSLLLVGISPVIANLIGSVFNILYNHTQIEPLLSDAQLERFNSCWQAFNVVVYPVAVFLWISPLLWLRPLHRALLKGESVEKEKLLKAQRYVINLPWWILIVAGISWLICIPIFPAALRAMPEYLEFNVTMHLVTSFVTASLIAVTQSFFVVELVSQRALYPVFFRNENPAHIPGAIPLNLTTRGIMWALSATVSPVVSLSLLLLIPDATRQTPWFGVAVGVVAIVFAMVVVWMFNRLVAVPVRRLKQAAMQVADGNLNVRVNMLRADEFGPLVEQFNLMVEGLREREHLQETFGRHVGKEAAQQILKQDAQLTGVEQVITVMFVDIRNFTEHSSAHSPEEVVAALNVFFRHAVEIVEDHGGMVNKFLGDGFMALFGIGSTGNGHALQAVQAGQAMLCCLNEASQELEQSGWPEFQIGIGINTGPAIVGSIGSPKRQEYTAIGDTVNVASRVESLTKKLGHCLLVTDETRQQLPSELNLETMPPQTVKGKGIELHIFAVQAD